MEAIALTSPQVSIPIVTVAMIRGSAHQAPNEQTETSVQKPVREKLNRYVSALHNSIYGLTSATIFTSKRVICNVFTFEDLSGSHLCAILKGITLFQ